MKIVIDIPDTDEIPMNATPLSEVLEEIKGEIQAECAELSPVIAYPADVYFEGQRDGMQKALKIIDSHIRKEQK